MSNSPQQNAFETDASQATLVTIPTLTTERLVLRAPRLADLPAYIAFRTDPQRTDGLGGPLSEPECFDQLTDAIGMWLLRGFGRFIVADKQTDQPLGIVGPYHPLDWPEPEIAWSVFAEAEGRGIAYEAALASRAWAYQVLGWRTAISMIAPSNTRSAALARRMGCTRDADYPHPEYGPMQVWRHPGPDAL
jgi:ribosomal-protein-alanine N-acetyltransferase